MCRGEYMMYQYSSDTITKSSNNSNVLNFNKRKKNNLYIIIFCVKHNREQTKTQKFKIGTGHGREGCHDVT